MVSASDQRRLLTGTTYSGWIQQVVPGLTSGGTYTVSVWARGAAGGEIT